MGSGGNGEKGTGNKKHKWKVQNRQGEVKNSMGNGEAKEFICTTHGHGVRRRNAEECVGGCRRKGEKGEENMGQL